MHPSPTFMDSQNSSFKYLWDLIRTSENDGPFQWGSPVVFSRDKGGERTGKGREGTHPPPSHTQYGERGEVATLSGRKVSPALILDKSLVLSDSQFSHLQNQDKNSNLAGLWFVSLFLFFNYFCLFGCLGSAARGSTLWHLRPFLAVQRASF